VVLTDVMNSKNVGVLEVGPLFANSALLGISRFHVRVKNRNLTDGLLWNAWTSQQNYALQSAQESGHRSQIRLSASERCAATSTERNERNFACFESLCAFPLHPVLFGGERFDDCSYPVSNHREAKSVFPHGFGYQLVACKGLYV